MEGPFPARSGPAPGRQAIEAVFASRYPDRGEENTVCGTQLPWRLGGPDPLEDIGVYDGGEFWHLVTYGFSDLRDKRTDDPQWSGMGFELTVRLRKCPDRDDQEELACMCGVLQSLARYVFLTGAAFAPYEYIWTGQTTGLDSRGTSRLTGFLTMPDPMGMLDTPNGRVALIQLVGATRRELELIMGQKAQIQQLLDQLPGGLTDYERGDLALY